MNLETGTQLKKIAPPNTTLENSNLQRKCACGKHVSSGTCSSCQASSSELSPPLSLQAKLSIRNFTNETKPSNTSGLPQVVNEAISSPGQPLSANIRSDMESNFGQNLGHVRVHTDIKSAKSAHAVNALAYTVGRNIVFGAGQFSTQHMSGRKLLAHELTHVVQQGDASMSRAPVVNASPQLEQEADATAQAIVSEGRKSSIIQRSSVPLFARQQAQRTLPQEDGSEIIVSRFVTPGNCRLRSETRSSVHGDITRSGAFLEVTACRGNVSGGGRGELNYEQALNDAGQSVGSLLNNLAGGQSANDAFNTFRADISNVSPEAQLRFNLNLPGFRAEISGTAEGSLAEGVSATGRARVEVDIGPITAGIEPSVSGGTNETTEGRLMLTISNRRRQDEANCSICACSQPQITHQCSRRPPPEAPAPTASLDPVIIPLFFEYAEITPRPGWENQYDEMLRLAINRISQGYTITRIVGNTSPEGREQPQSARSQFQGNIDLAERRAQEAQRDLNAALRSTQGNLLQMRGFENRRQALSAGYPVEGRGELFGSHNGVEVPNQNLPSFLNTELQPPTEGESDQLQQRNIIGENLPAGVRAESEHQVNEFRAGNQSSSTLFPLFRRALIFLEPPPPMINLFPSRALRQVIGESIPCTEEHIRTLANTPLPSAGLFRGTQCNQAGERP